GADRDGSPSVRLKAMTRPPPPLIDPYSRLQAVPVPSCLTGSTLSASPRGDSNYGSGGSNCDGGGGNRGDISCVDSIGAHYSPAAAHLRISGLRGGVALTLAATERSANPFITETGARHDTSAAMAAVAAAGAAAIGTAEEEMARQLAEATAAKVAEALAASVPSPAEVTVAAASDRPDEAVARALRPVVTFSAPAAATAGANGSADADAAKAAATAAHAACAARMEEYVGLERYLWYLNKDPMLAAAVAPLEDAAVARILTKVSTGMRQKAAAKSLAETPAVTVPVGTTMPAAMVSQSPPRTPPAIRKTDGAAASAESVARADRARAAAAASTPLKPAMIVAAAGGNAAAPSASNPMLRDEAADIAKSGGGGGNGDWTDAAVQEKRMTALVKHIRERHMETLRRCVLNYILISPAQRQRLGIVTVPAVLACEAAPMLHQASFPRHGNASNGSRGGGSIDNGGGRSGGITSAGGGNLPEASFGPWGARESTAPRPGVWKRRFDRARAALAMDSIVTSPALVRARGLLSRCQSMQLIALPATRAALERGAWKTAAPADFEREMLRQIRTARRAALSLLFPGLQDALFGALRAGEIQGRDAHIHRHVAVVNIMVTSVLRSLVERALGSITSFLALYVRPPPPLPPPLSPALAPTRNSVVPRASAAPTSPRGSNAVGAPLQYRSGPALPASHLLPALSSAVTGSASRGAMAAPGATVGAAFPPVALLLSTGTPLSGVERQELLPPPWVMARVPAAFRLDLEHLEGEGLSCRQQLRQLSKSVFRVTVMLAVCFRRTPPVSFFEEATPAADAPSSRLTPGWLQPSVTGRPAGSRVGGGSGGGGGGGSGGAAGDVTSAGAAAGLQ
ncbi:unnamed protein product, partial [Phaeothamnion confervicola]